MDTRRQDALGDHLPDFLDDLDSRGLLDETLVVWAGEFGRTPFAQGRDGRDHNPFGFTIWMAGGGIKGGTVYGSTDDWGYKVIRQVEKAFGNLDIRRTGSRQDVALNVPDNDAGRRLGRLD